MVCGILCDAVFGVAELDEPVVVLLMVLVLCHCLLQEVDKSAVCIMLLEVV